MSGYHHLDFSERIQIETLLTKHQRISDIARTLHRDPKTIRDEILRNRTFIFRGTKGKRANHCKHRHTCQYRAGDICKVCIQIHTNRLCRYCGECCKDDRCSSFEEETCPQISSTPFVCNGCQRQAV